MLYPEDPILGEPHVHSPMSEADGIGLTRRLPRAEVTDAADVTPAGPYGI